MINNNKTKINNIISIKMIIIKTKKNSKVKLYNKPYIHK